MLNLRLCLLSVLLLLTPITNRAQTSQNASSKSEPSTVRLNELRELSKLARKNRDWKKLEQVSQELIADFNGQYGDYQSLGDAQLNLGKYDEAIKTYEKALEIAGMTTFAPPDLVKEEDRRESIIARLLTSEGNAYLKLHKSDDAIRLYTRAAEISPKPGLAYFNICATLYNLGDMERATPVCRKTIEVDPARADAYFVLGSALFSQGKLDGNNKYVAPEGTMDTLKKYLELAPDGPHVKDVSEMIDMLAPKK